MIPFDRSSDSLSTLDLSETDSHAWDVIVIGAGVAGASAALLCAEHGLKTLLVEAKRFPREKVCGGCLNARSQRSLQRLGVLDAIVRSGAIWLDAIEIHTPHRRVQWSMPRMLSVRRSTLDAILVDRAIANGADFICETTAKLVYDEDSSKQRSSNDPPALAQVHLAHRGTDRICTAKCILVADGLSRSSLSHDPRWGSTVAPDSRIGIQCLLPIDGALQTDQHPKTKGSGREQAVRSAAPVGLGRSALSATTTHCLDAMRSRLCMVLSTDGYVGISPTDGGMIDVAAAIDGGQVSSVKRPGDVARQILRDCHLDLGPASTEVQWLATPKLTRFSEKLARDRIFLIGDSIGYVEPFTGEGMSWALESAEAIVPMVRGIVTEWKESYLDQWNLWIRRTGVKRQRMCRRIARWSRRPTLASWILWMCQWFPPLRWELMRRVSQ